MQCAALVLDLPYPLLLDSSSHDPNLARFSFVAADPAVVIRGQGRDTAVCHRHKGSTWHPVPGDALAVCRDVMAPFATDPVSFLPPFQGGMAGYLGYEFASVLDRVPPPRVRDLPLADALLCLYDWVIAWDHQTGEAWIISTGIPATGHERAERARERLRSIRKRLTDQSPARMSGGSVPMTSGVAKPLVVPPPSPEGPPLRSTFTAADYRNAVAQVREFILAGDIFQANLSQRFDAPLPLPPFDTYRELRANNPAPFGAFFQTGEAAVLSISPERFLSLDPREGRVETRPIKGTRPRGSEPGIDERLAQELLVSEKDRAENVMIVDLLRNDLSRVCRAGTITVSELCSLERHPTVHHLVSTIIGRLTPGEDAFTLLRAAFPGGSITGAPKIRAMEIIAALEPTARHVYCGSIGYISLTGAMDTSIAIRTAVAARGRLYFSAGGGIVADSDPEAEYRETLDKAHAFLHLLKAESISNMAPS